jgi:hypothetical protein
MMGAIKSPYMEIYLVQGISGLYKSNKYYIKVRLALFTIPFLFIEEDTHFYLGKHLEPLRAAATADGRVSTRRIPKVNECLSFSTTIYGFLFAVYYLMTKITHITLSTGLYRARGNETQTAR